MKARLILAGNNTGVRRAERTAVAAWAVEQVATGQPVTCLAADPTDTNVIFAGAPDGVLRSDDQGRTWRPAGLTGHIVKAIAVNPHDPAIVYAGTKPAHFFISRDGGRSWSESLGFRRIPNRWWWFSPAEPPDRRPYVFAIAPSPTEPDVLLAGVEFGAVVRSADGGRTWSRHRTGALRDCHSLTFHTHDGRYAYEAGGTGGGAAFSQDGGRTFQKARQGLARRYGIVCAADPARPEVWYVCVASGPRNAFGRNASIYLYRRDGDAWRPIGWAPHPLPVAPTALVTRPSAPGELLAGLYNGDVWHSADHGESWTQLPVNLDQIWFAMLAL